MADLFDELAAQQSAPGGGDLFDELVPEPAGRPQAPTMAELRTPAAPMFPPGALEPGRDHTLAELAGALPEAGPDLDAQPGPGVPTDVIPYKLGTGLLNLGGAIARFPETIRRLSEYGAGEEHPLVPSKAGWAIAGALEPVTQGIDVGPVTFPGTQDLAHLFDQQIEGMAERMPRVAGEGAAQSQEADEAFAAAGRGDFAPLSRVVTDPVKMGGYVAEALPSFAAAYLSGGSLAFIGLLESAEVTKNAEDFTARTGIEVSPEEFARAAGLVATVNAMLERTGLDAVVGRQPGKTLFGKFFKTLIGGGTEAGTEWFQEFNTNVASRTFDPEQNLLEGTGAAALGGGGVGTIVSAGQQAAVDAGRITEDDLALFESGEDGARAAPEPGAAPSAADVEPLMQALQQAAQATQPEADTVAPVEPGAARSGPQAPPAAPIQPDVPPTAPTPLAQAVEAAVQRPPEQSPVPPPAAPAPEAQTVPAPTDKSKQFSAPEAQTARTLGTLPDAETGAPREVSSVGGVLAAQTPQEPPQAPAVPPATTAGDRVAGDAVTVFTPENQPVEARYEVVEAEDLIASHGPDGRPNPAFPAERQPRQRDRAASQAQIQKIAGNLNPALLEQSPMTDTGAPIVDDANIVESGNGRVAAIQLAARQGTDAALKEHIIANAQRFGVDPAQVQAMRHPVLVRRRTTELDERGQQEFARASNVSSAARLAPAEQAAVDAGRITEDDLALFEPGEDGNILAASNRAFVNRFLERTGSAEAAGLVDPEGRPNREAVARMQAAVFQKAYGDRDLVQLAAEDADPDVRNILAGLQRAAPAFARARGINEAETGEVSNQVVQAIRLFRQARQARQDVDEYLAQQGLFGSESAEAGKIASFIAHNTRSARTLGDAFDNMATLLENELVQSQNLSMFDGLEVQPGEIISHGIETAEQRRAERSPAGRQQGIFDAREPGPEPAPAGRREGEPGEGQRRAAADVSVQVSELGPAPFDVRYDGQASQVREEALSAGEPAPDRPGSADPVQLDIFTPQDEAASGRARPKPLVTNARVGTFSVGIDRITSPADAAHIIAPIRRNAAENFVTLVTDKDGRPLEIQRTSIGTIDGASVTPYLALGMAANVPGADTVWFAHNHPSGSVIQSGADQALTKVMTDGARALGLNPAGMIVVGPNNRSFSHYTTDTTALADGVSEQLVTAAARRRGQVPVTERRISRTTTKGEPLTSPALARRFIEGRVEGDEALVAFLDAAHRPNALETIDHPSDLSSGEIAKAIIAGAERNNAAAVIIGVGEMPNGYRRDGFIKAVQKVNEAAGSGLRILDVLTMHEGRITSATEQGVMEEGADYQVAESGSSSREGGRDSGMGQSSTPSLPNHVKTGQRGYVRPRLLNDFQVAQQKRFAKIEKVMASRLSKVGLARDVPDDFRIMMRRYRASMLKAAQETEDIIAQKDVLSAEDRKLISDVIEGELAAGVVPPEHVKAIAAQMQQAMESQTEEYIRLGMLSRKDAQRWRGKYLPRFYAKDNKEKSIPKRLRRMFMRVDGDHLKGRGMFEMVQKRDIEQWKKLGWEIRDPESDTQQVINNLRDNDKVLMWRDFTRAEREAMGEIRDAVYRFARGHLEASRDIAIGRLFKAIAESEHASPRQIHEDQVQVPDTEIAGTGGVKRYGALAGMWVHKDVWNDLEVMKTDSSELWRTYMRALSFWKEGKTAMNPVVHSNNIWSSWIMADLYGIPPWRVDKYRAALNDYKNKGPFYQEAVKYGLFGTEWYGAEVGHVAQGLTEWTTFEKAAASRLRRLTDYAARFSGARAYRRGMGRLYRAEDQFFKLLIYKDMREKGATIDEAIDEAERWIFNYADMPKTARAIKNSPIGLPFFSYTFKAAPALAYAAFTRPWAFAKWIALFGGFNYLAFLALFGEDADEREEEERKAMPEFMRGMTPFLTDKAMRWPFDRRPGVATYMDLSRRFPLGDLFDMENQMGGAPLPQPLMPNNPVFTTAVAMLVNKDSFTGRDIVEDTDTLERKVKKKAEWLLYQALPNSPMLPLSYSFDKVMNGVAHEMGEPVRLIPGVKEYSGLNYYGEPQELDRAIGSTVFGFKIREFDVEREQRRMNRDLRGKIQDLKYRIRSKARDQSLTEAVRERQIRDLREQIDNIVEKHRSER